MPLFFGMYGWTIATFCLGFYSNVKNSRFSSICFLFIFLISLNFLQEILPIYAVANAGHSNLIFGFLLGIVFYTYRDILKIDLKIFFGLFLIAILFRNTSIGYFITAACIFYLVLFLSTQRFFISYCKLPVNLSMGVFLYSFPIQQLLSFLFPQSSPFFNFTFSIILTLLVAFLSAKYLESYLYRLSDVFYQKLMRFTAGHRVHL